MSSITILWMVSDRVLAASPIQDVQLQHRVKVGEFGHFESWTYPNSALVEAVAESET